MATVPSWAGRRCDTSDDVRVPVFGKEILFARQAANALCRAVIVACERAPDRAAKVYRVESYNCRQSTGGRSWSAHAWPAAIDIDADKNPYSSRGRLITDMTPAFINAFKAEGFGWGGDWSSVKDPMHFSIATNEGGRVSPSNFDPDLATLARQTYNKLITGSWEAPAPQAPPPAPRQPGEAAPQWNPSWRVFKVSRPLMRGNNIKMWQSRMRWRGWTITPDGVYGPASRTVAQAFQREKRLQADGVVGPATWHAAWEAPVT